MNTDHKSEAVDALKEPENTDVKEETQNQNASEPSEDNAGEEAAAASNSNENDDDEWAGGLSMMDLLLQRLKQNFGIGPVEEAEKPDDVLEEFSLSGIAKYIKSKDCRNIIVMTGAGISTSAGIPDFRSPESGLYHNLEKYNLPSPQSIFELDYFKENPDPFFMLAKELYPGNFKPTLSHYFLRILAEKGMMLRNFTQNIDGLEIVAGMNPDHVIAAHGTFHSAHCLECNKEYSEEWEKERIFDGKIPRCEDCDEVVKPDIVFFGEALPKRFFSHMDSDFCDCDLLIVMGTSLVVQPFASLINRVPDTTPRLLINKEKAGEDSWFGGFDFSSERRYRDVAHLTTCDEGCLELAELLGWKDELMKLAKEEEKKFQKNEGKQSTHSSAKAKVTPKKNEEKQSTHSSAKAKAKVTPKKNEEKQSTHSSAKAKAKVTPKKNEEKQSTHSSAKAKAKVTPKKNEEKQSTYSSAKAKEKVTPKKNEEKQSTHSSEKAKEKVTAKKNEEKSPRTVPQ